MNPGPQDIVLGLGRVWGQGGDERWIRWGYLTGPTEVSYGETNSGGRPGGPTETDPLFATLVVGSFGVPTVLLSVAVCCFALPLPMVGLARTPDRADNIEVISGYSHDLP
ncbi:MAG: hypothetical protein CSA55_00585 [Ilumatobacter coccineus]|uniref:Uncharacterized protein n=1 Tax=Ilumatobacter coccineus TaxID=467094 RepID=A0A2G6KGK9_9ACTN|nr:MAG: hypothetical protein CSA55_00585 [Ilumatobacter coccineus]